MVHLPGLFEEIETLSGQGVNVDGRLKISDRAHLLFDLHKEIDGLREAELAGKMIGTTKRGIGPAYASKVVIPSAAATRETIKPTSCSCIRNHARGTCYMTRTFEHELN